MLDFFAKKVGLYNSIGLSPYVLDEAVGAFERPVGHVVQHPVPDSVPMAFEEPAEPVELFAAGGLGHRKPSAPVQGVLLLDFVLIVSVISVAQMPETGSPPLDYHIQTTGRLLQQFDLIIPSSLKKVQPTDSPPVCRLGFKNKYKHISTSQNRAVEIFCNLRPFVLFPIIQFYKL